MPSNRVVRVRESPRTASGAGAARRDRARSRPSWRSRPEFPPRSRRRPPPRPRTRGCPTSTAPTSRCVTIDPAGSTRPRPGAAPRARRRRLRRALRDRRRRRLRARRATRSTVEAHRRGETLYGADSKIPLHPHGALRGRGVAAARPGPPGAAVDASRSTPTGEGTDVDVRAGAGALAGQARLRRGPAGDRRRLGAGESLTLLREVGELRLASARPPAAGSRCRCPSRTSTSTATHWRLEFRALLPVEQLERPDLAAAPASAPPR